LTDSAEDRLFLTQWVRIRSSVGGPVVRGCWYRWAAWFRLCWCP